MHTHTYIYAIIKATTTTTILNLNRKREFYGPYIDSLTYLKCVFVYALA